MHKCDAYLAENPCLEQENMKIIIKSIEENPSILCMLYRYICSFFVCRKGDGDEDLRKPAGTTGGAWQKRHYERSHMFFQSSSHLPALYCDCGERIRRTSSLQERRYTFEKR